MGLQYNKKVRRNYEATTNSEIVEKSNLQKTKIIFFKETKR